MKQKFHTEISLLDIQIQSLKDCLIYMPVCFCIERNRSEFLFLNTPYERYWFLSRQCLKKNCTDSINVCPRSNPVRGRILFRGTVRFLHKFLIADDLFAPTGTQIDQLQVSCFVKHQIIRTQITVNQTFAVQKSQTFQHGAKQLQKLPLRTLFSEHFQLLLQCSSWQIFHDQKVHSGFFEIIINLYYSGDHLFSQKRAVVVGKNFRLTSGLPDFYRNLPMIFLIQCMIDHSKSSLPDLLPDQITTF